MAIEFDPAKDAANIAKHGMSLADAEGMDMEMALIEIDDRFDYGEDRWIAVGPIGEAICVLVYTQRRGNVRAISLRPASRREISLWRDRKQARFQ